MYAVNYDCMSRSTRISWSMAAALHDIVVLRTCPLRLAYATVSTVTLAKMSVTAFCEYAGCSARRLGHRSPAIKHD